MTMLADETDITELSDDEFEVVCDVLQHQGEPGWPHCQGEPARWIAWHALCCPQRPKHTLLCDLCKKTYQHWYAHLAAMSCGWCQVPNEGPLTYTPLKG